MSGISASLSKWFSARSQWLQIAATRLLQQPELTVWSRRVKGSTRPNSGCIKGFEKMFWRYFRENPEKYSLR